MTKPSEGKHCLVLYSAHSYSKVNTYIHPWMKAVWANEDVATMTEGTQDNHSNCCYRSTVATTAVQTEVNDSNALLVVCIVFVVSASTAQQAHFFLTMETGVAHRAQTCSARSLMLLRLLYRTIPVALLLRLPSMARTVTAFPGYGRTASATG
jgi:hypothetical protein